MYGVDSMRQLAMKFLERDELANFSFQNDFLKPFVVVMRQSKALEIRELIIRCLPRSCLSDLPPFAAVPHPPLPGVARYPRKEVLLLERCMHMVMACRYKQCWPIRQGTSSSSIATASLSQRSHVTRCSKNEVIPRRSYDLMRSCGSH